MSHRRAVRALEALGDELEASLHAAAVAVKEKHAAAVRALGAVRDYDGDDFDDADLLDAALDVLRPLQHLSDGRGNAYCVTCKQAGGCHPECKLDAVLKAADARDAAMEQRQGAVID